MSWDYGTLATEIYEIDKPIGSSFGDVEYYTAALAGISGRILEPAVGTGRMLIPLLGAGYQVDGIDTSPEMLAVCRQHCAERGLDPLLREADMTTFAVPGEYAAVIIATGSFALLAGRATVLQALGCFRESLRPGGQLIVDVLAPPAAGRPPELGPMRYWRQDSWLWTMQVMHTEYDPAANQQTSFLRYEKWQDGALTGTELQPFRLQFWTQGEFSALLTEAGFAVTAVSAGYDPDRAPVPDDELWTFHAARD
jgi:SAM-dependent methyltransferase